MTMRISVHKRTKSVLLDLRNHEECFAGGIRDALHDIGEIVIDEAKHLIETGPKTGRVYKRPGQPDHQASAPGEPPANDTGALVKSLDYNARDDELEVGEKVHYAKFLEDGTRKMKPRPHLVVAVNNTAGDALELLELRVRERIE